MNAKELRIGNLHEYFILDEQDERKEWWEVSVIDCDDIAWLLSNPDDPDYRPLLITEERLIGVGFTPVDDGYYVLKETGITWDIYAKEIRLNGCYIAEPDFMHELQNLVHALTGSELEINY